MAPTRQRGWCARQATQQAQARAFKAAVTNLHAACYFNSALQTERGLNAPGISDRATKEGGRDLQPFFFFFESAATKEPHTASSVGTMCTRDVCLRCLAVGCGHTVARFQPFSFHFTFRTSRPFLIKNGKKRCKRGSI